MAEMKGIKMNDDIDAIGKMITQSVKKVSKSEKARDRRRLAGVQRALARAAEDFILRVAGDAGLVDAIAGFMAEMESSENAETHAHTAAFRAKANELRLAGDDRDEWEIVADLSFNADQLSGIKHAAVFDMVEDELSDLFEQFYPPVIADLLAGHEHTKEDLESYPTE
jgi:hypothetical protein